MQPCCCARACMCYVTLQSAGRTVNARTHSNSHHSSSLSRSSWRTDCNMISDAMRIPGTNPSQTVSNSKSNLTRPSPVPNLADCKLYWSLQVPNPLPLSWGRTVKPYEPPGVRQCPAATSAANAENFDSSNGQQASTSYLEEQDLLDADFSKVKQPFQAVLINPGRLLPSLTGCSIIPTVCWSVGSFSRSATTVCLSF